MEYESFIGSTYRQENEAPPGYCGLRLFESAGGVGTGEYLFPRRRDK